MGEWRLGFYELKRKLGEGGMAQVYLARDTRLGREVAVKVLNPKLAERPGFRERFMREARVAAALDHPNIVPLYDFGDTDALYLVMPYVSGGSLQDMLPRTPLPVGEVVTYGSQIADALEYAHQRKVVHRDVKPANMLLHADGRLMLSDFGLAKIVSQANTPNAPRNRPDAGTPEYMAPEQVVGSSDARSDIYGLGVVLYLLLTGRLPFTAASSQEVMQAHLRRDPIPLRRLNQSIPAAMEQVVMRAMAKQPTERFQRANEFGAALLSALIAGDSASSFALGGRPSRSGSRPTGPTSIAQFPDGMQSGARAARSGDEPPPWLQRGDATSSTGGYPSQPPVGFNLATGSSGGWDGSHPASSIADVLPDLDAPFSGQSSGGPSSIIGREQSGMRGARSGVDSFGGVRGSAWGTSVDSQTTGVGPGLMPGWESRTIGRMPGIPLDTPTAPAPARRTAAPLAMGANVPQGVAPPFAPAFPMAEQPLASRPLPVEMRAALPGARTTEPPTEPETAPRGSRLWIVIAALLIIMLVAVVVLAHVLLAV